MPLPRLLIKVIDPGTEYLRDRSPQRRGPIFREGAVFGPGVPSGSRQATAAELVEMRAHAEAAHPESGRRTGMSVEPEMTSRAARELIEHGRTTLRRGGYELTAEVVTFWHGESVLEITVGGSAVTSSSMVRVSRRLTAQHEPILTRYLLDALQTG